MQNHKVIEVRELTSSTFILRFNRDNVDFKPGLHISVGIPKEDNRPYSIYSGIEDDYLEILVKEVPSGVVTPQLSKLMPNDDIKVGKPRGYFCLPEDYNGEKICFIATGTGIAPFHSYVKSVPTLNYQLYFGVKEIADAYEIQTYKNDQVTVCTSRKDDGDFYGRVSEAIKTVNEQEFSYFYICGSYDMIDDVYDILIEKGVKKEQIKTEGYF